MAIYHLEAKIVSRGAGRSAVAAAAYLSCSRMLNEYDGVQHDYTRKQGLGWRQVFLPATAPAEWQDRETLWNAVEETETAKDSRLAREFVAALPIELSREEQIQLLQDFIKEQFVADGMCADAAIHDPYPPGHNPHAHILLTVRPLDEKGKWQYKTEKEYLCVKDGEERGFTAAEFKQAQADGWEKQYQYKEVSCQEYDANDDVIGKYAVWYPSELESSNTQYPVVIFANGTGSTSSTYKPFLTHLSSWGFISVGNDDENTRTGASLEETIKFLIAENEKKDSIFYHKIDLDNIGIAGHSQGGPAVFNMVTNQEHGSMVKALYAASATSSYHTMVMADGWEYDISRVNIPTFLTAGTGSWDAGNATSKEQVTDDKNGVAQGICPLWSLQENYSLLPETVDKVIARKKNVDHGDSYKQFDGYMTAWFVYHLQGDTEAGKAFAIGGELSANSLYQDVQTNINE